MFGFYGMVEVWRGGVQVHMGITIGVLIPGDSPSREALAELGGGRASKMGSAREWDGYSRRRRIAREWAYLAGARALRIRRKS